jgi:predicted enzyme related to lactoylglutathione lyase
VGAVVVYFPIPCQDPARMARFWSGVLEMPVASATGGIGVPIMDGDRSPALLFTDRPEPSGPVVLPVELIARGESLLAEVARLEKLGAVVREKWHRGAGVGTVVLADPEGNTFRLDPGLLEAERRLLAEEGRAEAEPFWDDATRHAPSGTQVTVSVHVQPRER